MPSQSHVALGDCGGWGLCGCVLGTHRAVRTGHKALCPGWAGGAEAGEGLLELRFGSPGQA